MADIQYNVYGPYDVPIDEQKKGTRKKVITKKTISDDSEKMKRWWSQGELKKLRKSTGCYVFAKYVRGVYTPWYVGKTDKCFEQEVFQDHKKRKMENMLWEHERGKLVVFFISSEKKNACATKRISYNGLIEWWLIVLVKNVNRKLANDRQTDSWFVEGLGNWAKRDDGKKRPSESAKKLACALKLRAK